MCKYWCDIFTDTDLDGEILLERVREAAPRLFSRYAEAIDVTTNSSISEQSPIARRSPFVNYPLIVEFYPRVDQCDNVSEAARATVELVRAIKSLGYHAVPTCEFEDHLPQDVTSRLPNVE